MYPRAVMQDRIHRHQRELVGFFARRAPEAAEELAQEVWFRIARAAPTFENDTQFRAYAYAVARRLLIDHHRRRSVRIQLVPLESGTQPAPSHPSHTPHGAAVAADLLATVERCLDEMNPPLAQVFRWRTSEDVSFKEIAKRQNVSLNTALGRMHQATKKVRGALHDAGLLDNGDPR